VIHIGQNKIMAQLNESFSENTPEKMRTMLLNAGYTILEEDLTTSGIAALSFHGLIKSEKPG